MTRNWWVKLIILLCVFLYVFLAWTYYRWQDDPAWERVTMFPYASGAMFAGVLLVLGLARCFTEEYQLQTDELLLSSRHGKRRIIVAKLTAALLYSSSVVFGCWLLNVAVNVSFAGWNGWDWPLQQLDRFGDSPYELLVWQYVVVQILTYWLGCMVFGLFVLCLSARSRHELVVCFIAGTVFVLPFFVHNTSDLSVPWLIKNALISDMMRVNNLFDRPRFVSVGARTISLPYAVFYLYAGVLGTVFAIAGYRGFRYREAG